MIGDTEKSTSWGTGIEQQQIGFLVFTLRPDLGRLGAAVDARPDSVAGQVLHRVQHRRPDARGFCGARSFYRVMREGGAYSANDIRALENMNPIENGDTYLQPTNMAPLGSVPSPPAPGGTS
jgi:phage portal protein BeeE